MIGSNYTKQIYYHLIYKVIEKLSWQPILNIEDTIKFTTDWYLSYKTEDIYQLSENQIKQ